MEAWPSRLREPLLHLARSGREAAESGTRNSLDSRGLRRQDWLALDSETHKLVRRGEPRPGGGLVIVGMVIIAGFSLIWSAPLHGPDAGRH